MKLERVVYSSTQLIKQFPIRIFLKINTQKTFPKKVNSFRGEGMKLKWTTIENKMFS